MHFRFYSLASRAKELHAIALERSVFGKFKAFLAAFLHLWRRSKAAEVAIIVTMAVISACAPSTLANREPAGLVDQCSDIYNCFEYTSTAVFDRSIVSSVDNFFSYYQSDPNHDYIVTLLSDISAPANSVLTERFGVAPEYTFVPHPERTTVIAKKPRFSEWYEAKGDESNFVDQIDASYDPAAIYRWRIKMKPDIYFHHSKPKEIQINVRFDLHLEKREKISSEDEESMIRYENVTYDSIRKVRPLILSMRSELRKRYSVFLKDRFQIELQELQDGRIYVITEDDIDVF